MSMRFCAKHSETPWSWTKCSRLILLSERSARGARRELGEVWTPPQLRIFLQLASDHRLHAFYYLAAYTGVRRGELLYLRWDHVDLDHSETRITGSSAIIGGQRTEGTTKGGRSRTVSIDLGTVQVLEEHRKRQADERLAVGPEWHGGSDDYVFTSAWGEAIHPDTVSSLMATLIKRYNDRQAKAKEAESLPRARLHDLRHVHATILQIGGVAPGASFGRVSEHALPAVQRTALRCARRNDEPRTVHELGCQRPVASDATMMHLAPLPWMIA